MASPPPPPPPAAASAPPAAASGSPPPAQVVGNAFVHQYYNILHQSPELVYRFYQEASRLGRPAGTGADGMDTVTTMDAINEKIVSMGIDRAEIKAVDAQESLCGGVTVLVMGHLTGRNGVSREFVQSFFLAPQEKGYFVLNDILSYVGEGVGDEGTKQQPAPEVAADVETATPAPILANGTVGGDTGTVPQNASPQPECQVAEPALNQKEEVVNGEEVCNPTNDVEKPVVEETLVPEDINEVPNNVAVAPISSPPVPLEEAPKKSYASIVKVMKEYRPPGSAVPSRPAPLKTEKQASPAPAQVADALAFTSNPQSGSFQDPEVDAHAIYVRSLPLNATPQQLEEEFKRFGAIKHEGIQVRSNKIQGFCYGFVEFEDASAVQTAIEARCFGRRLSSDWYGVRLTSMASEKHRFGIRFVPDRGRQAPYGHALCGAAGNMGDRGRKDGEKSRRAGKPVVRAETEGGVHGKIRRAGEKSVGEIREQRAEESSWGRIPARSRFARVRHREKLLPWSLCLKQRLRLPLPSSPSA